jgi:hypothetical protein
MRTVIATTALTFLMVSPSLAAQQAPTGRLEGTVAPWIASRSVQAARVWLVHLESDPGTTVTAPVDARGRYHVDSLPAGRYLVQVSHPTLDSLDVTLPPGPLVIAGGRTTRSDFSLPSGDRLRAVVCPGVTLGPEKGVLAGRVVDAESETPIVGAKVIAVWTDISIDRKARKINTQRQQAVVSTGSSGEYRMCGVPATKALSLQLQHAGRVGAATQVIVSSEEGVVVRDLSLSLRSAPTIAALDSLESVAPANRVAAITEGDTVRRELALSGTAILAGTVRTESGQPVANAEIRVRHGQASTYTDDVGRFVLGGLPSGTQVMLVRHFGFGLAEVPVELRSEQRRTMNVRMSRAVALDSVRVVASRWPLAQFDYNRRTNFQGHFLTLNEIQRSGAKKTSDLLPLLGGYTMMGRGRLVKMKETDFDPPGSHPCSRANVVIDGVDELEVNDVQPIQIAGMELYKDAASAPLEYAGRANCGLIVIWLRPGPRRHGWGSASSDPAALQYNGMP